MRRPVKAVAAATRAPCAVLRCASWPALPLTAARKCSCGYSVSVDAGDGGAGSRTSGGGAEPAAAVLSQRRRAEHAAAVLSIHTVTATPRGKGGRKKSSHGVDVRFLPPVRNHTSCCRRETRRCTHVRTLMRMACARACACAPHPSRQSYLALHALYAVGCVHEYTACASPTVPSCCRPYDPPRTPTQPDLTLRRSS